MSDIAAATPRSGTGDRWLPLSAAALAGGQSRRMGRDKALLPIVEGGRAMLAIVLERLRGVSGDVMVVAGDGARYAAFGARLVPDVHPEVGALGGIHAAINAARCSHCLVVACDMPFLNPRLLERLAREPRDYDVLVPQLPGESRQSRNGLVYQTLHAVYSKRCLAAIETRIAEGGRQVMGFYEDVRVRTIDLPDILEYDPGLRSFFNANTPEALGAAARLNGAWEPLDKQSRSSR